MPVLTRRAASDAHPRVGACAGGSFGTTQSRGQKLAPSRTRSAGCPPKTAERQMRSLSGQSTCAALAGVSLRTHRRRLSDAGGRTADGVPSSVQRFGGGGGGDGGQAAAGSAVAAQIVTRSTPRRAPAGRSGCGGDGESAPDRKATARRERMRGAEEAGASKAQRLLLRGPGRPQIGTRIACAQ